MGLADRAHTTEDTMRHSMATADIRYETVSAEAGSRVYARDGSTVYAETGSEIFAISPADRPGPH